MLISAIKGNLNFYQIIISVISSLAVIFFTLPIHEWAHGFVSTKLGDPTPKYQGRLTLNPMAHIDWVGAAAILLFGIGWAKPVQVNARYYKNPKWGMALVALAGPLSNIITAAQINVYLAVFNLIPIPPFDGSRILFTFLPQKYYFKIMQYERYIFVVLFVLLYLGIFDAPISFLSNGILNAINSLARFPLKLFGV